MKAKRVKGNRLFFKDTESTWDDLESKTKKELVGMLRSNIHYETAEGVILHAPLYAVYLINAFFGSLTHIKEIVKK